METDIKRSREKGGDRERNRETERWGEKEIETETDS